MIIGQRGRSRSRPPARARPALDGADLFHHRVDRRRHVLVHLRGVVALDEIRRVAVAE
jgi:hypothetical protein